MAASSSASTSSASASPFASSKATTPTESSPVEPKTEPSSASQEEDGPSRASSPGAAEEEKGKGKAAEAAPSKTPAAAVVADAMKENPFDSEGSRILFDAMDELQSCVGNLESVEIDIPQLVICGSQSAGKSSLLQSLTEIPFPTGAGCCTRFATRIVSRRTPANTSNRFKITIVEPDFDIKGFAYPPSKGYQKYEHGGDFLSRDEFGRVMTEVSEKYMGISSGRGPDKKNFATEVLKVELFGPSLSHFSILDVPGIFTSDLAVNPGEMEGVTDMVKQYMMKPENIVICVADATTDLANQSTFSLATDHVDKKRLVTVFTKCDLSQDPSEVVSIVTGQDTQLATSLGSECFVVRNRTKNDKLDLATLEARTFSEYPWIRIPENRRGSTMLRHYLSGLLCSQMAEKFPVIQAGIEKRLFAAQSARHALGKQRTTPQDMSQYMNEIIHKYEGLAKKALDRPGQLPDNMRLRGMIKDANDAFAVRMNREGHTFEFEDANLDAKDALAVRTAKFRKSLAEKNKSASAATTQAANNSPPITPPRANDPFTFGTTIDPALKSPFGRVIAKPHPKAIFEHIRKASSAYQSTQLPGLVNPEILPAVFKMQTEKWSVFAQEHLEKVGAHVSQTFQAVLYESCRPDEGNQILHQELLQALNKAHSRVLERAREELGMYCERARTSMLQTTDSRFLERLRALRTIRLLDSLDALNGAPGAAMAQDPSLYFDRLHYSMDDNMVKDVHDVLKVYYQISIEGFIRHITHIIIEAFASNREGPMFGLSITWLLTLDDSTLCQFGREDDKTLAQRRMYENRISKLQRAHEISEAARSRLAAVGTA